jgi:glycosyltransferase involved in cell wall biosynthesis
MIIIDDGSTDNTLSIAREYERTDNRIKVFTQKNRGINRLAETYNRALEISKGAYIAILEGDDYWEHDKLQLQVELLEKNSDVILCWGQAKCVDSDKQTVFKIYPDADSKESVEFNNDPVGRILNLLLFKDWIPALTIIIRKDALMTSGGFIQVKGMPTVDLPTLFRLSLAGKFGFISRPLGCWRIYAGQVTKVYPVAISEGYITIVKEFLRVNGDNPFIKAINVKEVYSFHSRQLIIAYSRSGRYKLIRKEYKEARRDYIKSIFLPGGEYLWKLRSATGLFFGVFHLDIEWLARLLKRPTYNN